jgi:hypothetical protein
MPGGKRWVKFDRHTSGVHVREESEQVAQEFAELQPGDLNSSPTE